MAQQAALTVVSFSALAPRDPKIVALATVLRLKPETLLARIQDALPAVVEQHLYVQVGGDFRLKPESMARLLREFLGDQELIPSDLSSRSVGENLVSNRFSQVAGFLEQVFSIRESDVRISISTVQAARLAIAYGDSIDDVIDDIIANGDHIAYRMNWKAKSPDRLVSLGLSFLADKVLPEQRKEGRPVPRTLSEYFDEDGVGAKLALMVADERED